MNLTIVSFLARTIWFSTAGDCRAPFLARFVLTSGGSGCSLDVGVWEELAPTAASPRKRRRRILERQAPGLE